MEAGINLENGSIIEPGVADLITLEESGTLRLNREMLRPRHKGDIRVGKVISNPVITH